MAKHRNLVVAFVALLALALPASASAAKAPPEVRSTSFAEGQAVGTVQVGALVSRATEVTATVGTGAVRQRLPLTAAEAGRGTKIWSAEFAEGLQTCLPLRVVARNRHGNDVYSESACVFGLPNPLPPSLTFPFIGLG